MMPETGSRPTTAPRLIAAWPTIHAVTPVASSMPNAIGRAARDAEADEPEPGEQREHEQAADEAELLADDREDEVGVRVGQEQPLRAARAEADAVHATAAERDQRLRDLVAGVGLVLPRVQEREHARPAVRRRERERRSRAPTAAIPSIARGGWRRTPPTMSSENPISASTIVESRSGSSITSRPKPPSITSTGATGASRRGGRRAAASTFAPQHSSASFAISLGCTLSGPTPSQRREPSTMMPTPGIEHDDEAERTRRPSSARRDAAPVVVVERRRGDERGEPADRPDELAVEEVPRRAVVGERGDRRRREDHHEADDVEHARRSRRGSRTSAGAATPRWRCTTDAPRARDRRAAIEPRQADARGERRSSRGASFDDELADLGGEVVAARGVVRVRVERRARGREQHGVAGLRELRRGAHRVVHVDDRSIATSATPRNAAATSGPASPNATTPRRRGAARASTPRSRPLLRPPASSTTESNDSSARAASRRGSSPSSRRTSSPHQLRRPARRVGEGRVRTPARRGSRQSSRRPRARPAPAASAFVRS